MTKQTGLLTRLNDAVRQRVLNWLFPRRATYHFGLDPEGIWRLRDAMARTGEPGVAAMAAIEHGAPGFAAAVTRAEANARVAAER